MFQKTTSFWSRFTRSDSITKSDYDRQQSHLLASLIIFLVTSFIIIYLTLVVLQFYKPQALDIGVLGIFSVLAFPTYLLSRAGYYKLAAAIISIVIVGLIWFHVLANDKNNTELALYYQVLAVGIIGVFVSLRVGLAALLLILIGTVLMSEIMGDKVTNNLSVFFIFSLSSFFLVTFRYNRLLEEESSRQLAISEEKYRTIFEASSSAMLAHEEGIILEINKALEDLTGYNRKEAVGRHLLEFVAPDYKDFIIQALEKGKGQSFEVHIVHKAGHELQLAVNLHGYQVRDGDIRVVVMRNIGAEREAHEREIAFELERQKVGLMRQVISDVSHDLRTPITVLNNSLYLLKRSDDSASRFQRIEMMSKQIARLSGMVDDLLTINRLDKPVIDEVALEAGDLSNIVIEICKEQSIFAQSRDIKLEWYTDSNLPKPLIDSSQLKQAVRQLITNAICYTPEEGIVTVRTYRNDQHAMVEVCDTGIGIHPTDREHIFDLFYRVDDARSTDNGGMGLGLAITTRIAEAHGGKVEMDSKVGEGSTFRILLPITQSYKGVEDGSHHDVRSLGMI